LGMGSRGRGQAEAEAEEGEQGRQAMTASADRHRCAGDRARPSWRQ
jgi:hypothetical protein